jgi:nicotinamidase-related amidase
MSCDALLLIDLQRGMFNSSRIPPVWAADEIQSRVRELLSRARNAGVPVILVQHSGPPGHPLEEKTDGWELHPDITPQEGERVVAKRTPDAFHGTDLHGVLQENRVRSLGIAGIQTEFCVDTTCRRAFSLGYDVTLIEDAHSTWDTEYLRAPQIIEHHNHLLKSWFVKTAPAATIEFRP